jgi:hypothetical protein
MGIDRDPTDIGGPILLYERKSGDRFAERCVAGTERGAWVGVSATVRLYI